MPDVDAPEPEEGPFFVQESGYRAGRPSIQATVYHLDRDCRQFDKPVEADPETIYQRQLRLCPQCEADANGDSLQAGKQSTLATDLAAASIAGPEDIAEVLAQSAPGSQSGDDDV